MRYAVVTTCFDDHSTAVPLHIKATVTPTYLFIGRNVAAHTVVT